MTSGAPTPRFVLRFWTPLALQWLMMGVEGPFLAATIARLGDPAWNLAAYGVAYALAILVESPVIMLMSASTALVDDAASLRRLRAFAHLLNALSTLLLLVLLLPPVHRFIIDGVLGLPEPVSVLVYGALWILLPWPAAIGWRRFLQGLLIRAGRTRQVALGTVLRLAGMGAAALLLAPTGLPGAWVGAAALSAGVVVEAVAAHVMAAGLVRSILRGGAVPAVGVRRAVPEDGDEAGAGTEELAGAEAAPVRAGDAAARSFRGIARFYWPLALTSFIGLSIQPMLTFFMGRAPAPVESLAVFPVVSALSFVFRTPGLSYQEAAIALLGRRCEHVGVLGRFGGWVAAGSSAGLALVAFTPLAALWFGTVSGLPPALAELALVPTRVAVLLPALSVALAWQRAVLVQARVTGPITSATVVEVAAIAALFPLLGWGAGLMGVTAAMAAFVGGRLAGVVFLAPAVRAALRRMSA